MTLAEVRVALSDSRAHLESTSLYLNDCAYLSSTAVPKQLGVMFAEGRVVRIDVFYSEIRTASGAGVGDSEEKIKRLYPGRISVEPHFYVPGGHYLTYHPANPAEKGYGLRFETEDGTVTSFRAGTIAAISLVEGCS